MTNNNTKIQSYISSRMAVLKKQDEHAENLLDRIKANESILEEKLITLQLLIDKVSNQLLTKKDNDFYLTYHKLEPLDSETNELLQYLEVLWNVIKKFKMILEK